MLLGFGLFLCKLHLSCVFWLSWAQAWQNFSSIAGTDCGGFWVGRLLATLFIMLLTRYNLISFRLLHWMSWRRCLVWLVSHKVSTSNPTGSCSSYFFLHIRRDFGPPEISVWIYSSPVFSINFQDLEVVFTGVSIHDIKCSLIRWCVRTLQFVHRW